MMLSEPSCLGPIIAEDANQAEQSYGLRQGVHTMLEIGSYDRCGAFSPQGDVVITLVAERVHLLLDDVSGLASAASEQPCFLERGRTQLLVTVQSGEAPSRGLHERVVGNVCRQH